MTVTAPDQLTLIENIDEEFAGSTTFRPIHYIGSKLRLLDSITSTLAEVTNSDYPVCDLFAGSGTVAMALAEKKSVVAVDIQEYSRTICAALLKASSLPEHSVMRLLERADAHVNKLTDIFSPLVEHESNCLKLAAKGSFGPLCTLIEEGSLAAYTSNPAALDHNLQKSLETVLSSLSALDLSEHPDVIVSRYFGGVYFSYLQAIQLDALLASAAAFGGPERDLVVAATLSTASDIVNTVGRHFAQPIRPRSSSGIPKVHLMNKIKEDRSLNVLTSFRTWLTRYQETNLSSEGHRVIRGDYACVLDEFEGQFSAIYADPPYTRDHYSRFYHVLETMCFRDNPKISMTQIGGVKRLSRGLYREERHQSPFCIRSKAPEAFKELFLRARRHQVPLVLSYSPTTDYEGSRPRVMTLAAIQQLAEQVYGKVEVREAKPISHSKLTSTNRILGRSSNAERLFICRP